MGGLRGSQWVVSMGSLHGSLQVVSAGSLHGSPQVSIGLHGSLQVVSVGLHGWSPQVVSAGGLCRASEHQRSITVCPWLPLVAPSNH